MKESIFSYLQRKDSEKGYDSESGTFYIDSSGIVQRFEPAADNPFFDEKTEIKGDYTYVAYKSIRTFIVPKGVKGFARSFLFDTRVLERFELPDGLLSIGNNSFDFKNKCQSIFANCILPSVVIPESVQVIGNYAFGRTRIETLQLPATLHSPYGRQFKDAYIGKLKLPKEWKDCVSLEKYGILHFRGMLYENDNYNYLKGACMRIGALEFY